MSKKHGICLLSLVFFHLWGKIAPLSFSAEIFENSARSQGHLSLPNIGFVSSLGGASGALGLGLSYRPFSFAEIEAIFGSAVILRSYALLTRFYISPPDKWTPFLTVGLNRWEFDRRHKFGRFLLKHYGLLATEHLIEDSPSVHLGFASFGIARQITSKVSWFYEGGFFVSTKGGFVAVPTLGFGLRWYVI